MKGAPRSEVFDDVYFSAQDGLAETQHVFLDNNHLPERWSGRSAFTVCETGFGTGLNFIAVWELFDRTAEPDQKLHYISFEKYPLEKGQVSDALYQALSPRGEDLGEREYGSYIDKLCNKYPPLTRGVHRIIMNDRVTLTLILNDVNDAIPALDGTVDCWFLDGFKPSSNPDMWSETVFSNMARLSGSGTSFATFTAAGFVKRGLAEAGFTVEKVRGFGRKRDMLRGVMP